MEILPMSWFQLFQWYSQCGDQDKDLCCLWLPPFQWCIPLALTIINASWLLQDWTVCLLLASSYCAHHTATFRSLHGSPFWHLTLFPSSSCLDTLLLTWKSVVLDASVILQPLFNPCENWPCAQAHPNACEPKYDSYIRFRVWYNLTQSVLIGQSFFAHIWAYARSLLFLPLHPLKYVQKWLYWVVCIARYAMVIG